MSPWPTLTDEHIYALAERYTSRTAASRQLIEETRAFVAALDRVLPADPDGDALLDALHDGMRALRQAVTDPTDTLPDLTALAGLSRLLCDAERSRLPRSWDLVGLDADRAPTLVDRTCGVWPRACGERWYLDEAGVSRHYTCTRIASHTGRHAAGLAGVIVAVWEQTVPEVLVATGAAA